MYRDVWTLAVPMFTLGAAVLAVGLITGWSDGALGFALAGVVALVSVVWTITRSRQRMR